MFDPVLTSDYTSPERKLPWFARRFPNAVFYPKMIQTVFQAAAKARKGRYDGDAWIRSSRGIIDALERSGVRLIIESRSVLAKLDSPCVFVGNHMSTLETFVLPSIIQPHRPVTFVVKRSLVDYPVFKHVMISRDPVVVERKNPRDDFKTVMEEGSRRLEGGVSIIVFPQSTREPEFDPRKFNSMGVKLAKRAGVPVVPFALKTDAWGNGKLLKDFGKIKPEKEVHFCFGEPMTVTGGGKEEHAAIVAFIQEKMDLWNRRGA
ncbi:MAG: lysophospholipid acyltransferase family protein [Desulfovibrionales bacterium]